MLRLIPIAHPTGHRERFLCTDRDGNLQLSQPGYGFTILAGEPAAMSKTPFVIKGSTPAEAWRNWYAKAHPSIPLTFADDAGAPGDVVLFLENATHLPLLRDDGWDIWILDESINRGVLFRVEASLPCTCWVSRHPDDNKACSITCKQSSLVQNLHS